MHDIVQSGEGRGFAFKRLFKRYVKPALSSLGKEALKTGVDIGTDFIQHGDLNNSIKSGTQAAKNRLMNKIGGGTKRRMKQRKGKKIGKKSKRKTRKTKIRSKSHRTKLKIIKGKANARISSDIFN